MMTWFSAEEKSNADAFVGVPIEQLGAEISAANGSVEGETHWQRMMRHEKARAQQCRLAIDFGVSRGWKLGKPFQPRTLARGRVLDHPDDISAESDLDHHDQLDHPHHYRDPRTRRAVGIVAHLYDMTEAKKLCCQAAALSIGLRAEFPTDWPSWHCPGYTTMVVYTRGAGLPGVKRKPPVRFDVSLDGPVLDAILEGLLKKRPVDITRRLVWKRRDVVYLYEVDDLLHDLGIRWRDCERKLTRAVLDAVRVEEVCLWQRPRGARSAAAAVEGLTLADFAAVVIWLEELGFAVSAEPLVRRLLPEVKRKRVLTQGELDVFWYEELKRRRVDLWRRSTEDLVQGGVERHEVLLAGHRTIRMHLVGGKPWLLKLDPRTGRSPVSNSSWVDFKISMVS